MHRRFSILTALSLLAPGLAAAESPDPARIADALMPLLEAEGAAIERPAVEAALAGQIAAAAEAEDEGRIPRALGQAATLAVSAGHPATRALTRDLTFEILAAAGADDPIVAAWQKADPMLGQIGTGLGMAQSDIDALAALRTLAGVDGDAAADATATWQALSDKPMELILPARLNAWAAGAEAAWPDLTEAERAAALDILAPEALPSPELAEKVTGSAQMIWWLAGMDLVLTEAEAEASPDLIDLTKDGAFAGPLGPPIADMLVAERAIADAYDPNGTIAKLRRLNDYASRNGGQMFTYEAQRYMEHGY